MSSNTPNFNLTVKNYRCFPDNKPVHISMRNGFTAFVGVNNSGKSSLLRMFCELRNLFSVLSNGSNFLNALREPNGDNFSRFFKGVKNHFSPKEVFRMQINIASVNLYKKWLI